MPPPPGAWNPIEGPGDYTTTSLVHNETYPAISPLSANLSGKAVLIAGASRGIGQAIAVAFAQAGAEFIAIGARSSLETTTKAALAAAESAGRNPLPKIIELSLDVTDVQSVQAAVQKVALETGGRLDVVINNAGVLSGRGRVGETDPEVWWQVLSINLRGPYLIARACLPLLVKGDLKTVITVSSVGAHCISPGISAYQISKLAVVRLMEFIATEYGSEGIVALSIHPGNILTDIVGKGEGMDPKLKAVFVDTPQLCADSLVYLSKESRPWLNGRYINVTWDLPELLSDTKKAEIIDHDKLKVRLVV